MLLTICAGVDGSKLDDDDLEENRGKNQMKVGKCAQ